LTVYAVSGIAELARDAQGSHVVCERSGRRVLRIQPGKRQMEYRGSHLGASAGAVVVAAEPGAGRNLAEYSEVARGDPLGSDDFAVT
jgi:hypothetical protein